MQRIDIKSPPSMQDCEESAEKQENLVSSPDVILADKITNKSQSPSPIKTYQQDSSKKCSLFMETEVIPETPEEKIL